MRVLGSDVTKLFLYVVGSFVLAAILTPWLYNAGTLIGDVTAQGPTNRAVDWLGEHARKAEYADYFKRSLLIAGLLLLVPLLFALRMRNRPVSLRQSPWSIYLPARALARTEGQPLSSPRSGFLQLLMGIFLATSLLFAMGYLLLSMEWFALKSPLPWQEAFRKSIPPSVTASLVEEFVFRGILLGICLRTFRPSVAILIVSLLFAALHFLQPPDGMTPSNPESSYAGFEMLQLIAMRFQALDLVLHDFISLAIVGLILGYARYATASLWLPIGLHAGWIFAYTFFGRIASRSTELDPALSAYIGTDLKQGLIPLATLAVTGVLVFLYARALRQPATYRNGDDHFAGEAA